MSDDLGFSVLEKNGLQPKLLGLTLVRIKSTNKLRLVAVYEVCDWEKNEDNIIKAIKELKKEKYFVLPVSKRSAIIVFDKMEANKK